LLQVEVLLVVTSSIVLVGYHRFRGSCYTASQQRRPLLANHLLVPNTILIEAPTCLTEEIKTSPICVSYLFV